MPLRGWHAKMPRKETRWKEQRKKGLGQRVKPSSPSQANDMHKEQKEEQKKQGDI